jgi:hypothetical protein
LIVLPAAQDYRPHLCANRVSSQLRELR